METAEVETIKKHELHGSSITIRAINIQDMKLESDFIGHLSLETKHYRFFGAINNVSEKMLKTFCDVDGKNTMAFIATEQVQGKEVEIGVCRYVVTANPDIHEMAVTIADKWQFKGLGKLLINELISYGKTHGVKFIYSVELADNALMHKLSKEIGMQAKIDPDDAHQVIYSLILES
jgi:GNAT superfamily N-acetyltransferase